MDQWNETGLQGNQNQVGLVSPKQTQQVYHVESDTAFALGKIWAPSVHSRSSTNVWTSF